MSNRRLVNALLGVAAVCEHTAGIMRDDAGHGGATPNESSTLADYCRNEIQSAFDELDKAISVQQQNALKAPRGVLGSGPPNASPARPPEGTNHE